MSVEQAHSDTYPIGGVRKKGAFRPCTRLNHVRTAESARETYSAQLPKNVCVGLC